MFRQPCVIGRQQRIQRLRALHKQKLRLDRLDALHLFVRGVTGVERRGDTADSHDRKIDQVKFSSCFRKHTGDVASAKAQRVQAKRQFARHLQPVCPTISPISGRTLHACRLMQGQSITLAMGCLLKNRENGAHRDRIADADRAVGRAAALRWFIR